MGLARSLRVISAHDPRARGGDIGLLLRQLGELRPCWAIRFDVDDDGEPAIEILTYRRQITRDTRSCDLVEIRRVAIPHVDDDLRVFVSVEAWLRHQVAVAMSEQRSP